MKNSLKEIVRSNLTKLADEFDKFQELTEDLDIEKGPVDWRKKEMLANRLHNFYMGVEQILAQISNPQYS